MSIERVDSEIRKRVRDLMREFPHLQFENGSKHVRIRNSKNGDFIILSHSYHDARTIKHALNEIKRLALYGEGVIYLKTGRIVNWGETH